MGSVIPVDDHVPAGLAEGDLILLGDLIQHAAGGQRDGEVALIAAAALDHADEGIQLGVEGGRFHPRWGWASAPGHADTG